MSATTDWDGEPGGAAGCQFVFLLFYNYCDDALAQFSNYGTVVDVAAPGVQIYSSYAGGGDQNQSGTSMASPTSPASPRWSVARTEPHSASGGGRHPAQRDLSRRVLRRRRLFIRCDMGQRPRWRHGADGRRAAGRAVRERWWGRRPSERDAHEPTAGAVLDGTVSLTRQRIELAGIANVAFLVDGQMIGADTSSPYSVSWDTQQVADGSPPHRKGDRWGADGRPVSTSRSRQAIRRSWVTGSAPTARPATCSGPGTGPPTRAPAHRVVHPVAGRPLAVRGQRRGTVGRERGPDRAPPGRVWDDIQVRRGSTSRGPYSGPLDIYAADYDTTNRRQTVTVDTGSGPVSRTLVGLVRPGRLGPLHDRRPGRWLGLDHGRPDRRRQRRPAGIFLGPPGPPARAARAPAPARPANATPTPPDADPQPDTCADRAATAVEQPGKQGDWVGSYGSSGYVLAAGTGSSDLGALPGASLTMLQSESLPVRGEHRAPRPREPDRNGAPQRRLLGRHSDPTAAGFRIGLHGAARHLCCRL